MSNFCSTFFCLYITFYESDRNKLVKRFFKVFFIDGVLSDLLTRMSIFAALAPFIAIIFKLLTYHMVSSKGNEPQKKSNFWMAAVKPSAPSRPVANQTGFYDVRMQFHDNIILYGLQQALCTLPKPVCSLNMEIPFKSTCREFPFLR